MSMIGCFYAVADEDLEALIERPQRIHRLWGEPPLPRTPSFLARLLGARPAESEQRDEWRPALDPEAFDVDKAWHGIHFLLTGSDWGGDGPLAFMLHGGREIAEDLGYGPPHGFTSAEVREIDAALREIDPAALYDRADPAEFARHDLYPSIWKDEPKDECIGYVIEHFRSLQAFIAGAARSGRAIVAYLG